MTDKIKFVVFSRDLKGNGDGVPGGGGALLGMYKQGELGEARARRDNLELTSPSCEYHVARVIAADETED